MVSERPVVVGFDGSDASRDALDVAADEAARLGKPLKIVYVQMWSVLYAGPAYIPEMRGMEAANSQAKKVLSGAANRVAEQHPRLTVSTATPMEAPAPVLIAESHAASLVVVGSRGMGGFKGLLVGSVSVQVSAHAACPVLVVRPGSAQITGPVVVGVDGSEPSAHALHRAFDRAQDLGAHLVAVHAWVDPVSTGPWDPLPTVYDVQAVEQEEDRLLAESLAGWQEKYPDVRIERRLIREHPAKALLGQATPGSVIVLGSRGRGGFRGLLLGSVSQTVLHHASCPVELVR